MIGRKRSVSQVTYIKGVSLKTKTFIFSILWSLYWLLKELRVLTMICFFCGSQTKNVNTERRFFYSKIFLFGQKLSTSKNISLKVSKYDTSRVKKNIAFFKNNLCTFWILEICQKNFCINIFCFETHKKNRSWSKPLILSITNTNFTESKKWKSWFFVKHPLNYIP